MVFKNDLLKWNTFVANAFCGSEHYRSINCMIALFAVLLHFTNNFCLEIADPAPDFSLFNQNNTETSFSSFKGNGPIVVYFCSRNSLGACKKEAKAFQKRVSKFEKHKATVVAITGDTAENQHNFANENNISFSLLADPDFSVAASWEVPYGPFKTKPRSTYVFNKNGYLMFKYKSSFRTTTHAKKAWNFVKKLKIPTEDDFAYAPQLPSWEERSSLSPSEEDQLMFDLLGYDQ